MFWVATAPLSADGHVNVSPKGGPYFGLLDDRTFWYMDLTGSGNETISHLYEPKNGRITIMFNAFEGPPKIVRLFGTGRVLESGTVVYDEFVERNGVETIPGSRAIVVVHVHQVGSSCGFSVPFYEYKEDRGTLNEFFRTRVEKAKKGEGESIERYWAFKNAWSMDNLPGLKIARKTAEAEGVEPIKKMVGPRAPPSIGAARLKFTLAVGVGLVLLSPYFVLLLACLWSWLTGRPITTSRQFTECYKETNSIRDCVFG